MSAISVGCHLVYADTGLQGRGSKMSGSRLWLWRMKLANRLFAKSAQDGALPMLYAAIAPNISGGEYTGPGCLMNMRGSPAVKESSSRSTDRDAAAKLWDISADLTGVTVALES